MTLKDRANSMKLLPAIVLGILFFIGAYLCFPSVVKVQMSYMDEKDIAVYLVKGSIDDREKPDYELFHGGYLVVPVAVDDIGAFQEIQVKFRDRVPGEEINIDSLQIALGNYIFYQSNIADTRMIDSCNAEVEPTTGKLQCTAEDPYILIHNPGEMLRDNLSAIVWKYTLAWLAAYGVILVLLYWKGKVWKAWLTACLVRIKKERYQYLLLLLCLLGGFLAGRLLQEANSRWFHFEELQNCEIIVWSVMVGFIYWLMQRRINHRGYAVLATVLIAAVLLMVVKGTTTFLTADEQHSIKERARLDQADMRHWLQQAGRTSYMLTGAFFKLFPREWVELKTGLEYQQVAKLQHWTVGALILLKTIDLVQVRIINRAKDNTALQTMLDYVCLSAVVLLQPTTVIALKSFNYDLMSMCFAVLAAVYALIAFQDRGMPEAWLAVIFSTLGLLEKVTAVPIWGIACVIVAFIAIVNKEKKVSRSRMVVRTGACAVGTLLLTAGIAFLNQFLVLEILKGSEAPIQRLGQIFYMVINRVPVINKIIFSIWNHAFSQWIVFCIIMGGVIIAGALLLYLLCRWHGTNCNCFERVGRRIVRNGLLVFLLLGVLFTALRIENSDNVSIPHYLCYVIKNYIVTVPTLVTVLAIVLIIGMRYYKGYISTLWCIMIVTWAAVPVYLYRVRWNPTWLRYLDLFHCLYGLMIAVVALPVLHHFCTKRNLVIGTVCTAGALHLWEVSGSMPAFTYFAPFWYGLTTMGMPEEEREMCVYWGDNRASLGHMILDYCEANGMAGEPINIYYGYIRGEWITKPDNVTIADREWNVDTSVCSLTDHDFYAIDVQSVLRGMVKEGWPEGIKPVITVRYRGYVIARIYQGSQLRGYFT